MSDNNHFSLFWKALGSGSDAVYDALDAKFTARNLDEILVAKDELVAFDEAGAVDQTGISTITDITTCAVTFTAVAGHAYKVSGHAYVSQQTGAGTVTLTVREGTTTLGTIGAATLVINGIARLEGSHVVLSPSAGAHTYKLSVATSAETCSVELSDADKRARILVTDLGLDPTA